MPVNVTPKEGEDYADAFIKLLLEIMTNLAIIIIYAVSIIALLIVLVVRVVVLWAMMAVSPLLVLFLVIPQLSQGMEEFDLKKTFVQHAIAPVIIVASLSIGFIMLESMIQYNVKLGTILDEATFQESALKEIGFDRTGQFLAMIMGIVVIWLGVFGAASKTLAATVTDKLRDTVKAGAVMLAKLPTIAISVPVTTMDASGQPTDEKGKVSLHAGLQLLKGLPQLGEQKWFAPSDVKKELEAVGLGHLYSQGAAEMSELENAKTPEQVKGMLGRVLVGFDWDNQRNVGKLKEKLKLALSNNVAEIDTAFGTGPLDTTKKTAIGTLLSQNGNSLQISGSLAQILARLNGTDTSTPGSSSSIQNQTTYSGVINQLAQSTSPTPVNSAMVSAAGDNIKPLLTTLVGASNQKQVAEALRRLITGDDTVDQKRITQALEKGKDWIDDPESFGNFVDAVLDKENNSAADVGKKKFVTAGADDAEKKKRKDAVEAAAALLKVPAASSSPATPSSS
jgi:hypothetical protein